MKRPHLSSWLAPDLHSHQVEASFLALLSNTHLVNECASSTVEAVLSSRFPLNFPSAGWVAGFNFPLCVLSHRRPDGAEEHREHLLHERRPAGPVQLVRCSLTNCPSCLSYFITFKCSFLSPSPSLGHLKGGQLFLKSSAVLIDWKDFLLGLCEMSVLQSWPLCCCVRCVTSQPQHASSQKPFALFSFFSFAFQPSAWVSSVNKRLSLFIGPEWRLSENCCSAPFEEAEAAFLLLPIGSYVTNDSFLHSCFSFVLLFFSDHFLFLLFHASPFAQSLNSLLHFFFQIVNSASIFQKLPFFAASIFN